ncbi:hypothetical protein ACW5F0_09205 [Luteimonas sp. A534]
MGSEEGKSEFFVTAEAAKLAIAKLTSTRVHPHFSGYLAAVGAAAAENRRDNLRVNFQQFYNDYLLVAGAPPERPYLQPFSDKGVAQLFNKNVAGSYAPSSLRAVAPIQAVIEFKGSRQQVTHTLKPDHEEIALAALTGGQRLPAHSLATFLFRDHKIPRSDTSDIQSVLQLFCETFGYDLTVEAIKVRFDTLYQLDPDTFIGVQYADA